MGSAVATWFVLYTWMLDPALQLVGASSVWWVAAGLVSISPMAAFQNLEDVDFRFLADLLEVSDSTLSQPLTALSDVGLIIIRKEPAGRHMRTWVGLTTEGKDAFARHPAPLRAILDTGQETTSSAEPPERTTT